MSRTLAAPKPVFQEAVLVTEVICYAGRFTCAFVTRFSGYNTMMLCFHAPAGAWAKLSAATPSLVDPFLCVTSRVTDAAVASDGTAGG